MIWSIFSFLWELIKIYIKNKYPLIVKWWFYLKALQFQELSTCNQRTVEASWESTVDSQLDSTVRCLRKRYNRKNNDCEGVVDKTLQIITTEGGHTKLHETKMMKHKKMYFILSSRYYRFRRREYKYTHGVPDATSYKPKKHYEMTLPTIVRREKFNRNRSNDEDNFLQSSIAQLVRAPMAAVLRE